MPQPTLDTDYKNVLRWDSLQLLAGRVYGFIHMIQVPEAMPVTSSNAFFFEWGYQSDSVLKSNAINGVYRMGAKIVEAPPVKTLTSLVVDYGSNLVSLADNYLTFTFRTISRLTENQGVVIQGDPDTAGFRFPIATAATEAEAETTATQTTPNLTFSGEAATEAVAEGGNRRLETPWKARRLQTPWEPVACTGCSEFPEDILVVPRMAASGIPEIIISVRTIPMEPGLYKLSVPVNNPTEKVTTPARWEVGSYQDVSAFPATDKIDQSIQAEGFKINIRINDAGFYPVSRAHK
jgi:hypothetical protein